MVQRKALNSNEITWQDSLILAKHAIKNFKTSELGQIKWTTLRQEIFDKNFDDEKYLSHLNEAQKMTVFNFLKQTYDKQNQEYRHVSLYDFANPNTQNQS